LNLLLKKDNENEYDYIKRITFGKRDLVYDIDYSEWAKAVLGKDLASDESRKRYYGAIGILEKIDEDVMQQITPKSQLEKARQLIGEQYIIKRQIQTDKAELKKLSNNFVKSISIVEELSNILEENDFTVNIPEYCKHEIEIDKNDKYKMIVHITDWHIGYIIDDCKGNHFNWDIANQRINKLIDECRKYIKLYNIKQIYVFDTGDAIEHTYMRKNQSQFCEFSQSEQINKAIEIIYRFIVALCSDCNVIYDSIYGNHDRMNGDASANLDGDNAETIIREQLYKYKELSKNERLIVVQRKHTDKEIIKVINNKTCKFIHGSFNNFGGKKDDRQRLKDEISMDNEFYDILFKGHEHNFRLISENNGRYIISTGCLSGYNDYSVNFYCTTSPSQTIVILDENKIELIKDVQLGN
jgi:hypothetical protein